MIGRLALGAVGAAVAAYGGWLLLQQGPADLVATLGWLAGGVLLHDGLWAPLTLLLGVAAARLLPAPWLGPAARFAVLVGPLTLLAVPVLGRFGARPDNPTLLDRDFWSGWAVLIGLSLIGVVLGAWRHAARNPSPSNDRVPRSEDVRISDARRPQPPPTMPDS